MVRCDSNLDAIYKSQLQTVWRNEKVPMSALCLISMHASNSFHPMCNLPEQFPVFHRSESLAGCTANSKVTWSQ